MAKNAVQIMPLIKTVKETPIVWLKLPAIKLPKGINPAKVIINMLITLPRKLSGTLTCKIVFIRETAQTLVPPNKTRTTSDNKYILDNENSIKEIEYIKEEKTRNLPL